MSLISSGNFVKNMHPTKMLVGVWYIELAKLEPRAEKTSNSEMVFFFLFHFLKGLPVLLGLFLQVKVITLYF